jgi:hypothetical protein
MATDTEVSAVSAQIPTNVAGKNLILNGGFDIWQRGTSFAGQGAATTSTYTADRWNIGAGTNITVSRVSSSTEGSTYASRMQKNATTTPGGDAFICHTIESSNAILLSGKTVTLSFNVRKGSDYSGAAVYCVPRFGTGTDEGSLAGYNGAWTGYSQIIHTVSPTSTMTTYTKTFTVPSGTKEIMLLMGMQALPSTAAGANDWIEFEKIQLEIGSVATPFSRSGVDMQGEIAKCQRYFQSYGGSTVYERFSAGFTPATTSAYFVRSPLVQMRATPSLSYSALADWNVELPGVAGVVPTALDVTWSGTNVQELVVTFASNATYGGNKGCLFRANNTTNARLYYSAEL